ncbi:hypothetical protein pEaSNUABM19_00371 [Erwinia phage pEa_SNUABM_19]|uniref:Uncharacterized protein n=1 Tax=Erwinia phage pEa_SNUABM_12 TaxID=2768773 RepID=A0A7L8ZM84_9CAUD|nr:hypothetical protein pEaSNUABM12_00370 [Erwinia phage pEa_SNUABM_12]QXO11517.1 hypothetical protein pEaSNUABM19_00371 [Erwinia phage pEa_SNUABM_19]
MSRYDILANFEVDNMVRTFDEFYEYQSVLNNEKYMCFGSTIKLVDDIVASVSINKYNEHVQYFGVWDNSLTHVIFSTQDEGFVQLFDIDSILSNDCLKEFISINDIEDADLERFKLTRENIIVLFNLHSQILQKLKKDETIQKNVL